MGGQDGAEQRLGELLQQLRDIGGIDLAAVIGGDGLVLASSAAEGMDVESVGAVAASGLLLAEALGREWERGAAVQTTLEFAEGLALLMPLDPDVALLILAKADTNLGRLRLVTRRARGELLRAVNAFVAWPGTEPDAPPAETPVPPQEWSHVHE